jgi:uncharacterized protein
VRLRAFQHFCRSVSALGGTLDRRGERDDRRDRSRRDVWVKKDHQVFPCGRDPPAEHLFSITVETSTRGRIGRDRSQRRSRVECQESRQNLRKHGVSFEEAPMVFVDPLGAIHDDPDHSENEHRELPAGHSSSDRLLIVSFTGLPKSVRITSPRRVTRQELRSL